MESSDDPTAVGRSRRALRTRTSNTGGASEGSAATGSALPPPGPPPSGVAPVGAESPRSEASDGRASRSSNPEFAAKQKAFMAKVTAATKGSMDTYLTQEMVSIQPVSGKRKQLVRNDDQNVKRRRSTRTNSSGLDVLSDGYCWICHKEGDVMCCETCPRVYHSKCIQLETSPAEDWVCPECVLIMSAENMETRSRAMRLLTIDQLCTLLKHALSRIKTVTNVDPFLKPVDPLQFPAYKDYISCPMDLQSIERNIRRKQYGSTESMLADCKWILHNCIIFNSPSSKLTSIAKSIVKICKHEMQEIENCPDCYLNAHVKKEVWFTEACRLPHPLVWAKLKGFPYWPGKVMRVNSDNSADIRFFGAHDRAWIPIKDVFLYSKKPPSEIKKKRGNIDTCFDEVEKHLKKLRDRFGKIDYANHRTPYDHSKEAEMIKILFPNYTLPFDIGKLGRRTRSYSFTGSERSRDDDTPTPSESGGMEDYEEQEETIKNIEEESITAEHEEENVDKVLEPVLVQDAIELEAQDEKEDAPIELKTPKDDKKEEFKEKDEKMEVGEGERLAEKDISAQDEINVNLKTPVINQSLSTENENKEEKIEMNETFKENTITADKIENETNTSLVENVNQEDTEDEDTEVQKKTIETGKEDPKCDSKLAEGLQSTPSADVTEVAVVPGEVGRVASSPPCEVTSTTAGQEKVEEKKREEGKLVEGIIADSNEKVIIEEEDLEEIDDVEPTEDLVEDSTQIINDEDKQNKNDDAGDEEIDDVEPLSDENQEKKTSKLVDTAGLLEAGVSITKIDRTKVKDKPLKDETKDNSDDISVTYSSKDGAKSRKDEEREESRKPSGVEKKRSSTNTEIDLDSENDSILTISKVVSSKEVRESPRPSSQSSSGEGRRSHNSSPLVQQQLSHPFFAPRLPGYRGPIPPMGPRGPHMMMGPGQGMMMRGQYRVPSPGPHGPPNLQTRPAGPLSLPPSLPSIAGPVAEQLNKVAAKLAETLKKNLRDTFADLENEENPDNTIKKLQIECEKLQWRHQQELNEMKHNADLVIMEMRSTMEQEKQKAVRDCRKVADEEKQAAIQETKKKQWCSMCGKEAIFYCCWNTSYCDYPCQQAHWPAHMSTCSQNSDTAGAEEVMNGVHHEPIHHQPHPSHPHYMHQLPPVPPHHVRGPTQHMRIPGDMSGMRFGMRPTHPGQMFNRPYYM